MTTRSISAATTTTSTFPTSCAEADDVVRCRLMTAPIPVDVVAANVAEVRARIESAARSAGRDPSAVRLIGVTKTRSPGDIASLVAAGVIDLGENRAQELAAKSLDPALVPLAVSWHMIGQCQTNKVASIARAVSWWHSVDRISLADQIARHSADLRSSDGPAGSGVAKVLVQVDTTGATGRGGVAPDGLAKLLDHCATLELEVAGLMTVAPLGADPRSTFDLVEVLCVRHGLAERSMGMSDDFEVAIASGATMIRVGRALFAERRPGSPNPS